MGYLPAGGKAARIGWDGQPSVPAINGALTIIPGVGIVARTDAATGRLLIDAAVGDPVQSFHLFKPGTLAVGTLGKWSNTYRQGSAYIQALQVNLGTAPTAGDASNYYRVKVSAGNGQFIVLPVSAAGVAQYSLNQGNGVEIVKPWVFGTSQSFAAPGLSGSFTPSQPFTITGMKVPLLSVINYGTSAYLPATVKASILDANMNELVKSYTVANTAAGGTTTSFAFPMSIQLETGKTYFVAIDIFEWYPATLAGAGINVVSAAASSSNSVPGVIGTGWTTPQMGGASPAYPAKLGGVTWRNAVDGSTPSGWPGFIAGNLVYSLLGSPSGSAAMFGDLTISVDTIGVPPAGAAGADINVHTLLVP